MKSFIVVALVAMFCFGLNVALAQPANQGDITFSVDVSGTPLTVTVNSGIDLAGLTQGSTQTITPDGAGGALETAVANPTLVTVNSVGDVDIAGDLGAQVLISFALPTSLFGSGGGSGAVFCTYNGTSACWVDVNGGVTYFDPRVGTKAFLDPAGGTCKVYLGGIFTVAANSSPDVYVGDAIITVSYVGTN